MNHPVHLYWDPLSLLLLLFFYTEAHELELPQLVISLPSNITGLVQSPVVATADSSTCGSSPVPEADW